MNSKKTIMNKNIPSTGGQLSSAKRDERISSHGIGSASPNKDN